jgi:hypothetical protein
MTGVEHPMGVGQTAVLFVMVAAVVVQIFFAGTGVKAVMGRAFVHLTDCFFFVVFESFLAAEVATVFEHVAGIGVEGPEGAFAGLVRGAGHFDETVIEAGGKKRKKNVVVFGMNFYNRVLLKLCDAGFQFL